MQHIKKADHLQKSIPKSILQLKCIKNGMLNNLFSQNFLLYIQIKTNITFKKNYNQLPDFLSYSQYLLICKFTQCQSHL